MDGLAAREVILWAKCREKRCSRAADTLKKISIGPGVGAKALTPEGRFCFEDEGGISRVEAHACIVKYRQIRYDRVRTDERTR